jgi:hypothetical protein
MRPFGSCALSFRHERTPFSGEVIEVKEALDVNLQASIASPTARVVS